MAHKEIGELTPNDYEELFNSGEEDRAAMEVRQSYYDGNQNESDTNQEVQYYLDGTEKTTLIANWIAYGIDMYVGSMSTQGYSVTNSDPDADNKSIDIYEELSDANCLEAVDVEQTLNAMVLRIGIECHEIIKEDNEELKYSITVCNPLEWQLVYDTMDNLMVAIYRVQLGQGNIHQGRLLGKPLDSMIVYTAETITKYTRSGNESGGDTGWVIDGEPITHLFGVVPIVVWAINSKKNSHIHNDLMAQSDEYNSADSMSGDSLRSDSDGFMHISGYDADDLRKHAKEIRETKLIVTDPEGSADYINKKVDVVRTDSRIARTREHIFSRLKVPDVEQIVGATGATSGIALALKFKPMIEHAGHIMIHLRKGIKDRISMINRIANVSRTELIENFNVIINFSLPVNRTEEWGAIKGLDGIVSPEKKLEMLSDVDDPQGELERLQASQLNDDNRQIDVVNSTLTPEQQVAKTEGKVAAVQPDVEQGVEPIIDSLADDFLAIMLKKLNAVQTQ